MSCSKSRRTFFKDALAGLAGATVYGLGLMPVVLRFEDPYRLALYNGKEGAVFSATDSSGLTSSLVLDEVVNCGGRSETGERFSLLFKGSESHPLPQGSYRVEHHKMNRMYLLLVPVWSDSSVPLYEAVIDTRVG